MSLPSFHCYNKDELLTSALNTNQGNPAEDWQERLQVPFRQGQVYGYCSI